MKKFLNFLAWLYGKMDTFDKSMIVSSFLLGASFTAPDAYHMYLLTAGLSIPGFWVLRWFVWVAPRAAWRQYQEEQEKTMELLKKDYSNERRF